MRYLAVALAAVAAVACSDNSSAPTADAISGDEKAAVQAVLTRGLAGDTLYPILSALVFPFILNATPQPSGSDTTKLVGIQLDVDATQDSVHVTSQLTAVLAWRGFRPATKTVDSVFFVIGTGLTAPVNDSLREAFSPDSAGAGTGFVFHQGTDSVITTWTARTGALQLASQSYGSGSSTTAGTLTLTVFRGSMGGQHHLTAKLVPDSSTTVTNAETYTSGIHAVKLKINGTF
ncbi:MAG TPA: hypothetical protein VIW26_01435 [Gemmatimonadales bacterium]|jgi:hypothetical protein